MIPNSSNMPNSNMPDSNMLNQPNQPNPTHDAEPLAGDAPTRPIAGALAAGAPAVSSVSAAVKSRVSGLFSPRLALLAALLYNPIVLAAYLLYLYGPVNTCVAGSLCSFGSYPALTQALLILAGSTALWILLYTFVLRAIESPGRGTGIVRLLRDLSRYERIRELLLIYGALLALLLVVALFTRRLTMPSFVVGAFGIFVCLYCANAHPATSTASVSAHRHEGEGPQP